MAHNTASNYSEKLLEKFVKSYETKRVVTKSVNTSLFDGQYTSDTGGTVSIKRPHIAKVSKTSAGDLTAESQSDIIAGKATGQIQNRYTVWTEWSTYEEALELNQLETILDRFADQLNVDLETDFCAWMHKWGGLCYGTPGTIADAWEDVAGAGAFLKELGASGEMYYVMPPMNAMKLVSAQSGLNASDKLVRTAWEKAQISRDFGGMMAITSNTMSNRTNTVMTDRAGTLSSGPTVTYVGAKDTMTQVLALTGLNGGVTVTLKAGEVIEFTGSRYYAHPQNHQTIFDDTGAAIQWRCVVTADTALTNGAGNVTVTSAGIYEATGQYNNMNAALANADTFNVLGTSGAVVKPNLFFAKDAFGIAFMEIPKLTEQDAGMITKDGIAIRVSRGSNITTDKKLVRFDMHPIFVPFNPLWGGQAFGK